jgi:alcohol dehydrogenase class IV
MHLPCNGRKGPEAAVISAGSCYNQRSLPTLIAMALTNYVTQIQFEFGAIGLLKQQRERVGIRRPLIVMDRGMKAADIIDTVLDAFGPAGTIAVYDGTPPNPNEAAVREAVGAYKEGDCDGIVAVGGGSSIDLAQGGAVCATHDGPLQSSAVIEGGADRITSRTAPVTAVPTTAGTGSEVGRGARRASSPAWPRRWAWPAGPRWSSPCAP